MMAITKNCIIIYACSNFSSPKNEIKILSSFTHPQVVLNLDDFRSSVENKKRYLDEWMTR